MRFSPCFLPSLSLSQELHCPYLAGCVQRIPNPELHLTFLETNIAVAKGHGHSHQNSSLNLSKNLAGTSVRQEEMRKGLAFIVTIMLVISS